MGSTKGCVATDIAEPATTTGNRLQHNCWRINSLGGDQFTTTVEGNRASISGAIGGRGHAKDCIASDFRTQATTACDGLNHHGCGVLSLGDGVAIEGGVDGAGAQVPADL